MLTTTILMWRAQALPAMPAQAALSQAAVALQCIRRRELAAQGSMPSDLVPQQLAQHNSLCSLLQQLLSCHQTGQGEEHHITTHIASKSTHLLGWVVPYGYIHECMISAQSANG
jgi:hypothetical protein